MRDTEVTHVVRLARPSSGNARSGGPRCPWNIRQTIVHVHFMSSKEEGKCQTKR